MALIRSTQIEYPLSGSFSGSFNGNGSGLTGIVSSSYALTASFINTLGSNAFIQGGNSFATTALLGTNDNQPLAFETSGSIRMFISNSGNIGIRTNSPSYSLDVNGIARVGDQSTSGQLYIKGASGTGQYIYLYNGAGNTIWTIIGGANYTILENSTSRFVVKEGGNVGIGTTTPSVALEVSGSILTTNGYGKFFGNVRSDFLNTYDNSKSIIGNPSNYVNIYDGSGNTAIRIDVTGSVGIGTTSPGYKLDISGSVRIRSGSQLRIDDTSDGNYTRIQNRVIAFSRTNGSSEAVSIDGSSDNLLNIYARSGLTLRGGGSAVNVMLINDEGGASGNASVLITGTSTGANSGSLQIRNSSNTQVFKTFDGGSVAVGTITSPTSRLQVKGSGASSGTTSLLVENSNNQAYLKITDDGTVSIGKLTDGEIVMYAGNFRSFLKFNSNKLEFQDYSTRAGALSSTGLILTNASDPFATNRLDVVGKAFIGPTIAVASASLQVVGATTSSLSSSLLIQNVDNTYNFNFKDNGDLLTTNNFITISSYDTTINGSNGVKINGTGFTTGYIYRNTTSGFLALSNDATVSTNITLYGSTHATLKDSIRINQSGSTVVTIVSGSVGIGITSPTQLLHVAGNALVTGSIYFGNGSHYLTTDNSTYAMISSNRALQLANSGNPVLTVSTGQNVGIGTTSPTSKLHVSGSDVSGSLNVNNVLYVSGSNVGIGITTPSASLHISGASGATLLRLSNPVSSEFTIKPDSTLTEYTGLYWGNDYRLLAKAGNPLFINVSTNINFSDGFQSKSSINSSGQFGMGVGSATSISATAHVRGSGATSATTALRVENSNLSSSLVVLNNGNVGIGVAAPTKRLEVYDGTVGDGLSIVRSTVSTQRIELIPNDSTASTLIKGGGNDKPFYIASWANGNSAQPLHFGTNYTSGLNEVRMTISTTGNVGIGTTSPSERLHIVASGSGTDVPLYIAGTNTKGSTGYLDFLKVENTGGVSNPKKFFRINNSNGAWEVVNNAYSAVIMSLDDTGNMAIAGTLTQNSDESLKTNIQTIPNALEKTLQLRGVEYDRISTNKHEIGLIAQEVEQIFPELVSETNGIKSVAYSNVVSILIESIKELKQEIDTLRKQINNTI